MPSAAHLVAGVAKTTLAAVLMVAAGQNSGGLTWLHLLCTNPHLLTLTSGPQGLVKANQPRFDSGLTPVSLTCGPHTSGLTLDSRVDPLM